MFRSLFALVLLAGCDLLGKGDELGAEVVQGDATALPVTTADAAPEIGPVAPGELSAPADGVAGEGLRALLVGPQGVQVAPRQATVVFDRPMVALSDLDAMSSKVPLSCTADGGAVQGRGRWAGTSTAVWLPDGGKFPKATAVSCEVPAGTAATDGTKLVSAVHFGFETERPALDRSSPTAGWTEHDPKLPLLLVFNQPVSTDAVSGKLRLTDANGKAVKTNLRRPELETSSADPDEDDRTPRVSERDLPSSVLVEAKLARDTEYTLTLDAGLRGEAGPLGLAETHSFTFRTVPPPGIVSVSPHGDQVSPFSTIEIEMVTATDAAEIGERLEITPKPREWNPADAYAWRSWSYSLRLEPMTSYTVKLKPGAKDRYGQVYKDGETWTFTTGHLPSLIDTATGALVYPANNPRTLPMRSRNASTLNAGVRAVDIGWVMDNMRDWKTFNPFSARMLDASPVYTGGAKDDKVRVDKVDLSPHLTDGHGLVYVEVWSPDVHNSEGDLDISRALLQVTDLGTTLKVGPGGATVWVTRLSDGRPVDGADVELYRGGASVWTGKTNNEGLAISGDVIPKGWEPWRDPIWAVVRQGADTALTSSDSPHDLPVWSFGLNTGSVTERDEWRLHSFTDRGVYKPGDTMHVALSARKAGLDGLSIPEGAAVSWSCRDARGLELGDGKGALAGNGWYSFDITVAAQAALGYGDCNVTLTKDGEEASTYVSVPVYEYRAPSFRVDVAAPENAIAGDTLVATGNGRYLFGAPMANAEARWSARATEVVPAPKGWDNFSFRPSTGRAWWDHEYFPTETLSSGEGKLGADGAFKAEIKVPLTEEPKTRAVEFEYTVTDVARQRISNRASTLVHPADLYVGLRPMTSLGTAGQALAFEVVAVTPEGVSTSGVPIELTAVRRTWDVIRQKGMDGRWTWVSTPKDDPVEKKTVASGGAPVPFSFTPTDGGYYVVKAELRDSSKRLSRSEDGVYVAGGDVSWARDDQNKVELVPDKRRYVPGDVAKILIKAPRPGLTALVTVEREGIIDRQVRPLASAAEAVEIPLGEDAVPNVFVSVVLTEGAPPADSPNAGIPAYYLGYTELTVDPNGRRLAVDIATDKDTYQPGETVTIALTAGRRQGSADDAPTKPAAGATVVLWAVDYGVLSLTGYQTPDAFSTYYAHHPLRVLNADNRTFILDRGQYLSKGAEPGGGGGETGRARSNFVTTPLWSAALKTGPDGKLSHSFQLPDNLTTFQIMAMVTHGADAFGSDDQQVRVSRPLIANPALPRVLRVGDRALAGVTVHNNRDTAHTVEVTAVASGVTLRGSPRSVEIPAGAAMEVPFALTDPVPGHAKFTFTVKAQQDQDAVEHSIPVLRPIPAETVASAGIVAPRATETIAALTDVIPGVGGLSLEVSPTVMVGAESSLQYLLEYPHGCLEQTTSKLFAAVLAKELGPRLALDITTAQLDEHISGGLGRIEGFRHASGGLTTWPGSREPSALATAAALEAMFRAGKGADKGMVRYLREFLSGKWIPSWWGTDQRLVAQSRVALTLARLGQGDAGYNSSFYQQRQELSLTGRAELLEAIARTGGPDARTKTIIEDLKGSLFVEADAARLRDQDDWSALWDGEMSGTAAFLSALVVAQPDNPLTARLARGLVDGRAGGFWGNTFTTLRSFRALADYASKYEQGGLATGLTATLGGAPLFTTTFDGPRAKTSTTGIDDVKPGELVMESQGGTVYYETRLSYAKAKMEPRDEGFTLSRTYAILEGTGEAGKVTPGALIQVSLRVVTPVDRHNVALIDPLPAGLEPVNTMFKTEASAYGDDETPDTGGYYGEASEDDEDLPTWSAWVFNHRELRDDRVVLYADTMPAGIHTYQYLARATTPGDYSQPAATVEEMYKPEHFGRTEAGRFIVGEIKPVAKAQ